MRNVQRNVQFPVAAGLLLAVVHPSAPADEGMWLPNRPPVRLLKQRYGFEPGAEWLEHLQKSCVRMGASGALVSPDGLLMTNHHVASDQLAKLSTPQRDLLTHGFLARTREEELRCPDMEVEILWSIEDVTGRIRAAAGPELTPAARFEAQRKAMTRLEQESQAATGLRSQVVTLYRGARYHLYRYKRYDDVRLVMAPEKHIAFFGGDNDNFEYPRFCLDVCFLRIYENGRPLRSEHFLKWSAAGAADGELTFVVGHPARTQRIFTYDHLRFLRDVEVPHTLRNLWRREVQLATFCARSAEHTRIGEDDLYGVQNSRKAWTGILGGLLDPQILEAKRAAEQALRAAVAARPEWQAAWGDAWERIADAQQRYREFFVRYQTLREGRALGSDLFRIALTLVRLADELPKPSEERLREYRDSELDSVYLRLYSPAPIHESLEIERIASGLSLLAELLGGEDPLVAVALDGLAPQPRAEQIVRGCKLADVAARRALAEGGKSALDASEDPMIRLARLIDPEARVLRKRYEDEVESVERENYARIAAACFELFGEDVYPDATGTLRLSFGPIRGYREEGREIPPFTTLAGLYERHRERGGQPPFDLPQRWLERRDRLDLNTPFNFVCTADIIGGNSGSPVVNRAGEVVGLIFDGNLPGLVWDIVYTDERGRAVAVDSRAIIEVLRKVYDADALADEIVGTSGGKPR